MSDVQGRNAGSGLTPGSRVNEGGKIRWDSEVGNVYHFISEVMLNSAFEVFCLFGFIYKI